MEGMGAGMSGYGGYGCGYEGIWRVGPFESLLRSKYSIRSKYNNPLKVIFSHFRVPARHFHFRVTQLLYLLLS